MFSVCNSWGSKGHLDDYCPPRLTTANILKRHRKLAVTQSLPEISSPHRTRSSTSFNVGGICQHEYMIWIELLLARLVDWLWEIPPDLLGRKVERFLDEAAERRHSRRKGRSAMKKSRMRKPLKRDRRA